MHPIFCACRRWFRYVLLISTGGSDVNHASAHQDAASRILCAGKRHRSLFTTGPQPSLISRSLEKLARRSFIRTALRWSSLLRWAVYGYRLVLCCAAKR